MRRFRKLLSLLTAAAIALTLLWAATYIFRQNYVILCGGLHRRDATQLDLQGAKLSRLDDLQLCPRLRTLDLRGTGLTAQQYQTLTQQLPECTILWDIPFQGQFLSREAESLAVTTLTAEDVALLDHLPRLLYIDALACEEYDLLLQLQQRHPDCHILYSVAVGDRQIDCRVTDLTVHNADAGELAKKLSYLPQVQQLHLTGILPPVEELEALRQSYPEIAFTWETAFGTASDAHIQTLDLRDTPLADLPTVEAALAYYPSLTRVDMRGCGLNDADMMTLADRHPEITFLWNMEIAGIPFPTDAEQIDISGNPVSDLARLEAALPYFPNLKKVVMCGCGIGNEAMDSLNRRYENIRFVWSVNLGGVLLRTDATTFMPVKYGAQVTTEDLYDLRYCTDMICIDLGHMDVWSCEWAAYMPELKYLLLADTRVSDLTPLTGLKRLIYLELFLTQVTDLSPLESCTALEDINLCYTYGDPTPLTRMPWLQTIWWSGHWSASSYAHQFRQNNPDIRLEFDTLSSTGNGWRELENYYDMRDLLGVHYMTG